MSPSAVTFLKSLEETVSQCALFSTELLGSYVVNSWAGRSSDTFKSASKMEGIVTKTKSEGKPEKKCHTSTGMNYKNNKGHLAHGYQRNRHFSDQYILSSETKTRKS